MRKSIVLIPAICFLLASIVVQAQNNHATKANADKMAKLIGTWRLIEFADMNEASGKWEYRYGEHPLGFFTYTKTGILNLNISVAKPLQITEDSASRYTVNLLHWLDNYALGYFGTYTVDFSKNIITHHVTGGSLPWYVDTDQPRPFVFKGDTLIIGDNKTWKRVLVKAD